MMFIKIKDLSFRYKNSKDYTISSFSIDINKGEIISILGESGSGKSTVLRLLSGLEVPSKGTIEINDQIVVDNSTFVLPEKRGIGMVFQDYALFPHMTVAQNIKFGLKDMKTKDKDKRLEEVLYLVSMKDYKDRYPYELSGGQQQRVALARALAPKPYLLLLDEPFSNLDAHLQSKIREELKEILNNTQTTSVFVTHNQEDAKSIADRVILLNNGEIVKEGRTHEVLNNIQ